jgi:hypothetical protein
LSKTYPHDFTKSQYLKAVRTAGIDPTEAETLPENELEQRVFGPGQRRALDAWIAFPKSGPPKCTGASRSD